MHTLIAIALGGAAGALGRYAVVGWVNALFNQAFPYGTLVVNVVGSFLIGVVYVFVIEKLHAVPEVKALVMVGFLGAFTTFSTFSLETVSLLESGRVFSAALYVISSVVLCVLSTFLGMQLGKL